MINVRDKGKKGETEFCNRFNMFFPKELKRNLLQTREGGADVTGCQPFQIEIKRCEKLEKEKWWGQVNRACNHGDIPIVAYRQNKQPWRFLIPVTYIGLETNRWAEIDEDSWVELVMREHPRSEGQK